MTGFRRGAASRLLATDGNAAAQVLDVNRGPVVWSPDSTKLAYVQEPTSNVTGNAGTLKAIDLATGKRHGSRLSFDVATVQPDGSGFRQLTHLHGDAAHVGVEPVAWSADGSRLLGGGLGDDFTAFMSYAIDPIHSGMRLITKGVTPSGLSADGRFVVGQTGSAATSGLYLSTVVRVPWAGGGRPRLLLRHAVNPSFNG
jgi:Tol biopolymer transport system component